MTQSVYVVMFLYQMNFIADKPDKPNKPDKPDKPDINRI